MTIIKKIINWLKNLFRKLFSKKRKLSNQKIHQSNKNNSEKKQKGINEVYDGSLPSYMLISAKEKEMLLYSLSIMKNMIRENYTKLIEKEEAELIKKIKSNDKKNLEIEKKLDIKYLNLLLQGFSDGEKKEIYDKYQVIVDYQKELNDNIREIDKTIKLIEKNNISFVAENEIAREIDNINCEKNMDVINSKIDYFNKKTSMIVMNIDEDFLTEVLNKYNKINFITISTTIIDKDYEILRKLEEDFKKHRFNRSYYERETNKIKKEINRIRDLKNNRDIYNHIQELKNELYTKSKDKYDLLYNDEVILDLEKECNNLLDRINTKVVDIKKEKEEVKDNKYIENILLRFQDMELARKIIMSFKDENIEFNSEQDIINYISRMCSNFCLGINEDFNFERNKTKTELVIFYNDINRLINKINNKPYISIDHINFKMDDLIEASKAKKEELTAILDKKNIKQYDYTEFDDKISLLEQNTIKKNKHILKKNINEVFKKDDK